MPDDAVVTYQCYLANEAKNVIDQRATGNYQFVGGELPGGQPLQIHVGLDLGMVLFAESMTFVQFNDLFFWKFQTGPPALYFDVRDKERLSFFVVGALYDSHDSPKDDVPLDTVGIDESLFLFYAEKGNSLSRAGRRDLPLLKGMPGPGAALFFARVPLDDVVNSPVPGEFGKIGCCIMCRVGTQEKLLWTELTSACKGFPY